LKFNLFYLPFENLMNTESRVAKAAGKAKLGLIFIRIERKESLD